ncbi:MAG: Signal peptidase I [uncultured Solirubrobacteraceae bacterium]|uniref:Signal peptidase I n=1 Tax=uncultured Solirubrobacteraceae bacterium TaxID=1162706 RepID=A0A6J4TWN1_9ACTN|nr:MAG: Signal peptidase I [uncultured Solirubrobacteraceae bacterium]
MSGLAGCSGDVRVVEKSMEPTIGSGDRVTLDENAYADASPYGGDIVSAVAPAGAKRDACGVRVRAGSPCGRPTRDLRGPTVVKRVLAGPGQTIAVAGDGRAIVDGDAVDEPYMQPCAVPEDACALPRAVRVPDGHYFLLGDNRPYSSDSRAWGPVPQRSIEGRVLPARPVE